jgi:hypothetical protein
MNHFTPLAETAETVTLSRRDYEAVVAAAEDRIDNQAIDEQERREALLGKAAARADYLPGPLVDRLLARAGSASGGSIAV